MNLALLLHDRQYTKFGKGSFEDCPRIKIFNLFRPTRAVFQLLWRVALNDQEAAGLEGPFHTTPLQGSLGRRTELCENFDHHIEFSLGIIPVMHIDQLKGEPARPRFVLHHLRRPTLYRMAVTMTCRTAKNNSGPCRKRNRGLHSGLPSARIRSRKSPGVLACA